MTFVASVTSDLPSGRSRRRTARDPKAVLFVLSFVTDDAVLILPRERAQDVREVVRALEETKRDRYL